MTDLRPYPEYNKCEIPFLDHIPDTWIVERLWAISKIRKERNQENLQLLSVFLNRGVILYSDGGGQVHAPSRDLSNYQVVHKGDFVLNNQQAWRGSVGVSEHHGIISPAYIVLKLSDQINPQYGNFLFRSPIMVGQYVMASRGVGDIQRQIYSQHVLNVLVPIPPPDEQDAIVRFLDVAEKRIRRYIRAKQKLIKLLNEQMQAIIQQAVTRGLNSDVPMKDSGVEWYDKIPSHWDVVSMRRVIFSAIDGPHFSPSYFDEGIPFLSARNIKNDRWQLDDVKFISEEDYIEFSKRVVPKLGDVLYTKGGTTGVARVVDLDFKFQVWVHVAVLKINKTLIIPEYLASVLNSSKCYEQSQLFTRGATNQDLGLNRMKNILFPLPATLDEQREILHFIDTNVDPIRATIQEMREQILLIQEYRTRLIADVVTGKVDVRGVTFEMPEEFDDDDQFNEYYEEDPLEDEEIGEVFDEED